ncbi:MAG: DUF4112 domain-containing protein [Chloracidobacterium sp.]|nr:DUF4112 domain-containing protein [Chloracidobacterium sp.]
MDKIQKQVEIEEGLDNLAHYLDGLFRVPGTGWRFGLDAVIGLIPNVGDTITSFASFYILFAGVRYGVPKITLLRMAFNIGLDYVVGMVPFIGDAFDFVWRSINKMDLIWTRRWSRGRDDQRLSFCIWTDRDSDIDPAKFNIPQFLYSWVVDLDYLKRILVDQY